MEFTVQEGKLWFLQTRNGKRTGAAMVKIAMDLLHQGMIDEKTALMRCEPNMAGFFLLRMGVLLKDEALIDDALNQYYWHIKYLQDPESCLLYTSPAVPVEVVHHKLGVVRSGADVLPHVQPPDQRAVQLIAVDKAPPEIGRAHV